jgi:hypothetical protein
MVALAAALAASQRVRARWRGRLAAVVITGQYAR